PPSHAALRSRSYHARPNVIAQLSAILGRARIHHPFARNLHACRLRSILVRPLWHRPVIRPRRPQAQFHRHHHHTSHDTPHSHSPYATRADSLYHALRRTRRLPVSFSELLCLFCLSSSEYSVLSASSV